MTEQKTITASLEGARVIVTDEKQCELQEYDFAGNRWVLKDAAPWPLARDRAAEWVAGWNDFDKFAAVNILTRPADYGPGPAASPLRSPHPSIGRF